MYTTVLGYIVLGATALVLWFALPVDGKVRPWITPRMEPLVVIAIGGAGVAIILIILGVASIFV